VLALTVSARLANLKKRGRFKKPPKKEIKKNQVSPPLGDHGRKLAALAFNGASTKSLKV
jgi:hypothetical protein